jgi:hypothetical protein
MDTFALVGLIVGILAGIIAILDKTFQFLPLNRNKRSFEKEFKIWKNSEYSYLMPKNTFQMLIGHINKSKLDEQRSAFALINSVHYGDNSMHELIKKNFSNKLAASCLFNSLAGKGIRVGWRSEFVLSQMDKGIISELFNNLPTDIKNDDSIKSSIDRIENGKLEAYLKQYQEGSNQKLQSYAHEVLTQIKAKKIIE